MGVLVRGGWDGWRFLLLYGFVSEERFVFSAWEVGLKWKDLPEGWVVGGLDNYLPGSRKSLAFVCTLEGKGRLGIGEVAWREHGDRHLA